MIKIYAKLAVVSAALTAIYALEQAWQPLGWWVFVVLTLSLGMGHGALDAVLLLALFVPKSKTLLFSAAYLLLVLLTGWVLSWFIGLALLALIVMSLWHFGELQDDVFARIAVGGASVMAPMVTAHTQMAVLVQPLLVGDYFAAWLVWYVLAIVWCLFATAWVVYWAVQWISQKKHQTATEKNWHQPQVSATLEITCVVALYIVFSPLLAFALYFGLWHSIKHIVKVQQAMATHNAVSPQQYALAVAGSVVVTLILLGGLWFSLGATSLVAQDYSITILQWLIVALAALTLPHLMLVSHSRQWLKT